MTMAITNMAHIQRMNVAGPTIEKPKYGLLTVASVVTDYLVPDPKGLYMSLHCIPTGNLTTMCPDGRGTKTFQSPTVVDGVLFPLYTGVNCRPVGGDFDQLMTSLQTVNDFTESRAVEAVAAQLVFGTTTGQKPTVLAGANSPTIALAQLESHARQNYAGVPTLHVPVIAAESLLQGVLVLDGDQYRTKLGSKVVIGAGYDIAQPTVNGVAPAGAGSFWMYATGEVTIARSALRVVTPQVDYVNNQEYGLLERFYIIDTDCYRAAVQTKVF